MLCCGSGGGRAESPFCVPDTPGLGEGMSGKTPASFDDVTVGGFPYQVLMEEVTWTWKLGLPRALSHRTDLAHELEKHGLLCHFFRGCQGWLSLRQLGVRRDGVQAGLRVGVLTPNMAPHLQATSVAQLSLPSPTRGPAFVFLSSQTCSFLPPF